MFDAQKCLCLSIEKGGYLIGYFNCLASIILIFLIIFNFGNDFFALICSLIGAVIYFISSYFLITGIKSRSHIYVQPFRFLCFIGFIAITFVIVFSIIQLKDDDNETIKFYHVILEIIALIVETYILIIVASLHKRFKSEMFGARSGYVLSY
ncbi:hypothetical protein PVAND_000264 [Polypedilum vanderplanki]|uniref:Uncharacterized protein n=1 Tax=Polypedilum vanderplanki TaxID=319348 RepID=A0A9J6BK53_POLVA|nr:hypothetical protein PVAND_000264 [Polypedilum vanderplanki]